MPINLIQDSNGLRMMRMNSNTTADSSLLLFNLKLAHRSEAGLILIGICTIPASVYNGIRERERELQQQL